jgi:hypothetical protein
MSNSTFAYTDFYFFGWGWFASGAEAWCAEI